MGPKKKPDTKGPKPGTKQAKAAAEKAAADKATQEKKPAPEEPKKPSVKEVIGGASWTGKLPVNMLSEHCQKQKWEKPEYSMVLISKANSSSTRPGANCGIHDTDENPRWLRILRDAQENRPQNSRDDGSASVEGSNRA